MFSRRPLSDKKILVLVRLLDSSKKILVFLALLGQLWNLIPFNAFISQASSLPIKEDIINEGRSYPTTTDGDFDISSVDLMHEDEKLRTENSKTFQRVDGTFVLAMYNEPIHYQVDGIYQNIDNSLDFDSTNNSYANNSNKYKFKLPKNVDDHSKFKLQLEHYQLDWSISGVSESQITDTSERAVSKSMENLTNLNTAVTYFEIQENVDLEYILSGNKIKENIILNTYIENYSLSFNYSLKNLMLHRDELGNISFINENGEEIFAFSQLYMIDKNNEISNDVEIIVNEIKKDEYQIIIIPSDQFLENAVYPVSIDPTIISSTQLISIEDTYVNQTTPTTNYYNAQALYLSQYTYDFKSFIKFEFPTWMLDKSIVFSKMTLFGVPYETASNRTIELYANTENVDFASINYYEATQPAHHDLITDYTSLNNEGNFVFNITTAVKDWQSQGINDTYGFTIKDKYDFGAINAVYASEYTGDFQLRPSIEIGYTDDTGIKDYWTYNSQDVGSAGVGYVSDYSGQLTFLRNDFDYTTEKQSLGVSFSHSNKSKNTNVGYGQGWNISYNLQLIEDAQTDTYYTLDFTGNKVYYYPTSCDSRIVAGYQQVVTCYIAEDGSGTRLVRLFLTVSPYTVTNYLVTKDNVNYYFTNGYLSSIVDTTPSIDLSITISRNSINPGMINYVKDDSNNYLRFNYDSNSRLASILLRTYGMEQSQDADLYLQKATYSYIYNTDQLANINYYSDLNQDKDILIDSTLNYTYDSLSRLSSAFIVSSEEIVYSYGSTLDDRVSKIESFFNDAKFSEVNYEYRHMQTIITDHSGNFLIYKFDNYGHTVNMIDGNGNAMYKNYLDIFFDLSASINGITNYDRNHEMIYQSTPQDFTYNPVANYSFEQNNPDLNWIKNSSANYSKSTTQVYSGLYSAKILTGYIEQTLTLDKGVYTLTGRIFSTSASSNAYISMNGIESNHIDSSEEINQWVEVSVPINIESDQTQITIRLYNNSVSNTYFDSVSIYSGLNSPKMNHINNASFEHGITSDWLKSDPNHIIDYSIYDGLDNTPLSETLGNRSIKITGDSEVSRSLSTILQRNYFSDSIDYGGKLFIGGWADKFTAPTLSSSNLDDQKFFRIKVEEFSVADVLIGTQYVNFNQSIEGWQFAYGEIFIASTCSYVKISFEYQGEGEVLFDGLSSFYQENRTIYNYDEFGRMEQIVKSDESYVMFVYANDEDVYPSEIEDQNGNSISIESDGIQLISVVKNNVKSTPVYNAYGQVSALQLKDVNDTLYFQTSTAYSNDYQFISSTTNEYGNTTNYYNNQITGLLSHIRNSKFVETNYEYYDNGQLLKVYIGESFDGTTPYVKYIYDSKYRLIEIELDENYKYFIEYDAFDRITNVSVNNQTLMSYTYILDTINQETYLSGKVDEQTYGTGDKIKFFYNDDNQIQTIQFIGSGLQAVNRFVYEYDSEGRISEYTDLTNNFSEYYEYNFEGRLIKAYDNQNNSTEYEYSDEGELTGFSFVIGESSVTQSTNFYYNEDINSAGLYDRTEYQINTPANPTITKEYNYEAGALRRLSSIDLLVGTNSLFTKGFEYFQTSSNDQTIRILRITYTVNGANTTYRYGYLYDALGNIYQENYSVNGVGTRTINYTYDDSNQLIKEVSFNYSTSCTYGVSTDTTSCYIKEFTYDINGNLTLKRTMNYNYETLMLDDIPVETRTNKGLVAIAVMVSGDTEIEIGDSLSLSFMYYLDTGTLPLQIVSGVTTTCTYSAVDTTTAGYYLLPCVGKVSTGKIYNLEFTVLIKVGEPDLSVPYIIDMMSFNYDDTWLDQLENYTVLKDGVSKTSHLTYDLQGNPTIITNFLYGETSYDHATFTWFGRQLMGIKVYNSSSSLIVSISYTYNDQGYRTSKTINGVTTTYTLQDDKVIYETDGSYGILYSYDYDGSLIGFNYDTVINDSIEGLNFFYVTNQSGDITHILNSSGVSVIEYIYDAYGNILNVLIATGYTLVAARNPYTFKGYRYDSEINMYYLNSRYYNPEIGRFLNADGLLGEVGNVQSTNMYAYCANNPVMYIDPSGEFLILSCILIGAILGSLVAYNVAINNGVEGWDLVGWVAFGAVGGGALGYLAAPFIASFLSSSFTFTIPGGIGLTGYGSATLVTSTITITGSQLAVLGGLSTIAGAMYFAKKDIKDVNRAANQVGVDRDLFRDYIHEEKFQQGMKPNENFSWKQLIDLAKELLKSIRK